jgi:hypothetical protein
MALTFTKLGKEIVSRKRVYQAVSDRVNIARVRMEVLSDNVGTPVIYTATHDPDIGTSDTFTFEINYTLFRQLYDTEWPDDTDATAQLLNFPLLRFRFIEIDDDGTEQSAVTDSSFDICYNITQPIFSINDFDIDNYRMTTSNGSSSTKFMTSAPRTQVLFTDDYAYLSIAETTIAGGSGLNEQELIVERYDSSDSLLGTDTVALATRSHGLTTNTGYFQTVRVTIASATSYILCYVQDVSSPNTARSEVIRFNRETNCGYIKLEWVNEFGAWDYYYFKGEQIKELNTDTRIYQKSTPVNPTTEDYGNRVYDNVISEKWTLYTDTVSQNTIDWLSKMFYAKKVAIYQNGNRYPAILNADKLVFYRDINGVYQISIPIIFSNNVLGNN